MQKHIEKLVDYNGLSEALGITVRRLRTFKYRGIIPHIPVGRRTVLFNPVHVSEALRKREVREI
jgi:hypothetical protein